MNEFHEREEALRQAARMRAFPLSPRATRLPSFAVWPRWMKSRHSSALMIAVKLSTTAPGNGSSSIR